MSSILIMSVLNIQAVLTPKYIVWEFNGQGIGGSTYAQERN